MATWRFDGHIAGIGTAGGTRLVIGLWSRSPFGRFVDMMIEDVDGCRTLIAPTAQIADFVASTYTFDAMRVEDVAAERAGHELRLRSPSVQVVLRIGRRTGVGRLLALVPRPLARSRQWARAIEPIASRLRAGVHSHGSAGGGRHEYYCALDEHLIDAASAVLDGADLGQLAPVAPPVRFGFGSAPRRPALVRVTTLIDALR